MFREISIEVSRYIDKYAKRPEGILMNINDYNDIKKLNEQTLGEDFKDNLQLFGVNVYRTEDIKKNEFKIF